VSHPELATLEGRLLFEELEPAMTASRLVGGPTLERMLLARHRVIDELITEAIDDGRVTQVVEIACGMSPRGWRFAARYGDALTYVEADLPDMAARKRGALERIASLGGLHRVVELDALRGDGERSLAELASTLDRSSGLAIVTEGLLTYFGTDDVRAMWRRFAAVGGRFQSCLYLADMLIGGAGLAPLERGFQVALSSFVQRRVHTHFSDEGDAAAALREAGFTTARAHRGERHPAAGDAGRDPAAGRIYARVDHWPSVD
jgi:O-methyltransferase involved in polyketide biosynthesis